MIDAAPNRSAGNAVVLVVDRDPVELVRMSADLLADGHNVVVARDLASGAIPGNPEDRLAGKEMP